MSFLPPRIWFARPFPTGERVNPNGTEPSIDHDNVDERDGDTQRDRQLYTTQKSLAIDLSWTDEKSRRSPAESAIVKGRGIPHGTGG